MSRRPRGAWSPSRVALGTRWVGLHGDVELQPCRTRQGWSATLTESPAALLPMASLIAYDCLSIALHARDRILGHAESTKSDRFLEVMHRHASKRRCPLAPLAAHPNLNYVTCDPKALATLPHSAPLALWVHTKSSFGSELLVSRRKNKYEISEALSECNTSNTRFCA